MRIVYFLCLFSSILYSAQEQQECAMQDAFARKESMHQNQQHNDRIDLKDYPPVAIHQVPDYLKNQYGCNGSEQHEKKHVGFKLDVIVPIVVKKYDAQSKLFTVATEKNNPQDAPPSYESLEATNNTKLAHHRRMKGWQNFETILASIKHDNIYS